MSNLRLVKEVPVIAGVNGFTADNIFTDDFKVFKVTMSDITANTSMVIQFRFVNSSGSIVATNYDRANENLRDTGSFAEYYGTSQTYFGFESTNASPQGFNAEMYVYNPTNSSFHTQASYQSTAYTANLIRGNDGIGNLRETSSITGIHLLPNSTQTFQTGVLRSYGIRID